MSQQLVQIDREHLKKLYAEEEALFLKNHPKCRDAFERAKNSLLDGVPMHWMKKWTGGHPLFVKQAKGGHFTDLDDVKFIDFCLGDTGSMTGHSPDVVVDFVSKQLNNGITYMLPNENAIWVGDDLKKRFGLPYWQVAVSATDANRFTLRIARHITKRPKILVFNYCYHGTVDEAFVTLADDGVTAECRATNIGPQTNPTNTTKVVEFNDVEALERALAPGDVAAVLCEPAMTNIGIVLPQPGFLDKLRELTTKYGTLLIIDETHTISAGPGGLTKELGLKPDLFTIGKAIGSGVPTAVYGLSHEVARRLSETVQLEGIDVGGIGGTLAGNALSVSAMRATLENILTPENYEYTIALAKKFCEGVEQVIADFNLPWIVKRLGCRTEYWFRPTEPVNGGEAAAVCDFELDQYMHLYALNRGILMTPFHNMALICVNHTEEDVDVHTRVFRESVEALLKKN
ncbi:glutamate-1-semialdehyde aminotransferase [Naegleria gruberi]|uniref:Glutamate-1-semialdehyde aminotransferase n=1 Tax=Naegleria gruberi TaxID=5762 RepID=D2V933_NAEGR|nr:glutamate-1-semialdehyde aminotransferase [Naegleria gruberi]EFC46639.1 glutamate-1-semialdehyde aminotransferase [Naegleria gruberi]|eukprot:XP_002679383.1 glutamate-1-semialdehyde aminotransferase [Naegleria gruberi strain NEG-M]